MSSPIGAYPPHAEEAPHHGSTDVARWLDRYVEAWRSNDATLIGELFSADAEYRYHPADEPVFGRDAIVASWLAEPDEPAPDAWYCSCSPSRVIAESACVSTYLTPTTPDRVFDNVFVMDFDKEGRCTTFTEWFRESPIVDRPFTADATDAWSSAALRRFLPTSPHAAHMEETYMMWALVPDRNGDRARGAAQGSSSRPVSDSRSPSR